MPPLSSFATPLMSLASPLAMRMRRWSINFPMRHASLSEGLRAAVAAGTMLLVGECLHNPLFSWAAIGAFLTCLADSAGSNRARLASMGGFALASTLGGMFAATLSGMGMPAGLLAIMVCAGVAGFARIYGTATGLVLMLAAGVSAILADTPVTLLPLQHSHVAIYFSGCAWATLLGLSVWRIHPFAPARQAVARVYGALARLADIGGSDDTSGVREEAAAQTRRHVRADIAAARATLAVIPADRSDAGNLYENLLIKLARADALLDCITALCDLRLSVYRHQDARSRRRIARILNAMALLLRTVQSGVAATPGKRKPGHSNAEDARAMLRLRQLTGRAPSQVAQLLQLRDLPDADGLAVLADWKRAARPAVLPRSLRRDALDALHMAAAHLRSGSSEVQHGLRCSAAAGITYLIVHLLHLPFGYWATMATMLVMQPSVADSWSRSMERAVGSIVGGVLAVALCLFIHSPLALALLVFPMAALSMGLRPVSYGLYSLFLTPVFVLVADVAAEPQLQLSNALLRAGNNVIGAVVAIVATYLLWPHRRQANLHRSLSHMIVVNLAYLRGALQPQPDATQMHARRREACVVNIESGLLLQRLLREGDIDARRIHNARTGVALARRLACAATHIWLEERKSATAAERLADAEFDNWLQMMEDLFERRITAAASCAALVQRRPVAHDLARADAVETVCLLAAAMYPELSSVEKCD